MPPSQTIYRRDYLPPAYRVVTVDLVFDLDPDNTVVTSTLQLERHPESNGRPLVLFGRALELLSLECNGRPLAASDYQHDDEQLVLENLPERCTLKVVTRIHPKENSSLEGLYQSSGIFCTQCEAQGFRKITYYPDRPDVMAVFTTTLIADAARYPVLLANGNCVERRTLEDGRHLARWHDPFPKPCYLFALVGGDLVALRDGFITASKREVELEIYVEHRNRDKCEHAMTSLKEAMRWDEETFGLEYDLDRYMILAVDDFNFGAMENKGLNIFNSKYVLASPATATDADYQAIEEVIGHEYFHNWTGNRVTCRDWFQLSLKEGLTVFRDQEFSADMTSRPVKRISDVRMLRASQFAEDAGPMAHPVRPDSYEEINNFYTATVYNKGAEVIRMYQTLLGVEGFKKGLRLYFERHDGQAVTTDDFLQAMADANGADLEPFRLWYGQAGTPQLSIAQSYDAAAQSLTLTVSQQTPPTPGQASKVPLHIPLALGLVGPDGNDIPLRLAGETKAGRTTRVLDLRQAEESFTFVDLPQRPVPSLLRGFSAPVTLKSDLSDADLAFLFGCDSDPFTRWEAGQQYATRLLLALVRKVQAQEPLAVDPQFVSAVRQILADDSLDPAFAALALTLPQESYLGECMELCDPAAIHAARSFLRRTLATELLPLWHAAYSRCQSDAPYQPTAAQVAARSLKNLALAMIVLAEPEGGVALAQQQYARQQSMTDVLAALAALGEHDTPARRVALDDFYRRWQQEPLVLDKWFTLQAFSALPTVFAEVSALTRHPDFNRRNPNRVRSLLGAFAQGNPAAFHRGDGAAYRLLRDEVQKLDGSNAQLAARLVAPLARWRRYVPELGQQMKCELEALKVLPLLSRDVAEIVGKSLAEGA